MTVLAPPTLGAWHSPRELEALQERRLAEVFAAAARSPFYRDRLRGTPSTRDGLATLPLTTKQDLRGSYPFGMLAVPRERLATYHESSGTTGEPSPSYYTEADWDDLVERYARKWVGIRPADVFLVRTPYALMITGHLAHVSARRRGATVVPGDNRSLAMPYRRVVRVLHDLGVTLSWSLPTEPLLWAAAARAAGYAPDRDFPALRALLVGGEPLSDARRRRVAEIWGVPVVEEYGSTETGSLAGQCPEGRLHLWADRALFEVYDPATGRSTREGRGQLVVTPLYREAMPLLRYNIEDEVEVDWSGCACGWHLPAVRVLGRSAGGYPVAGTPVTPLGLEELVFGLPARYQVLFFRAQARRDRLLLQIEVPPEHRERACAELAALVDTALRVPVEVSAVPPGGLVPAEALTGEAEVVKPRSLFGPDEDWSRALRYY